MPAHVRPRRGRHAAPRGPAAAVLLPGVLLAAVGVVVALSGAATGTAGADLAAPAPSAPAPSAPPPAGLARVADDLPAPPPADLDPVADDLPAPPADLDPVAVDQPAPAPPERASRAERPPLQYVSPVTGPVTSPFGPRWGRLHAGTDFGVPVGTPVRAVAAGVVEAVGYDAGGYGTSVRLRLPDGTVAIYAHLSRVLVTGGQVAAGDVLALSGNSGHSTGPHLHFELRLGETPFDARPWLAARGIQV